MLRSLFALYHENNLFNQAADYQRLMEFFLHPRIKMNEMLIHRRQKILEDYRCYLDLSNPERRCFFCQKQIVDEPVMHYVIPRFFLQSDDLWNIVYTHGNCHEEYLDLLPDKNVILRLENRNKQLLKQLHDYEVYDKRAAELKFAVTLHLPYANWQKYKGLLSNF